MQLQEKIREIETYTVDAAYNGTSFNVTSVYGCMLSVQLVVTVTQALTGVSFTPQWSNDGENWNNLASATNITASGSFGYKEADVSYKYFRVIYAYSAGEMDVVQTTVIKGYA